MGRVNSDADFVSGETLLRSRCRLSREFPRLIPRPVLNMRHAASANASFRVSKLIANHFSRRLETTCPRLFQDLLPFLLSWAWKANDVGLLSVEA